MVDVPSTKSNFYFLLSHSVIIPFKISLNNMYHMKLSCLITKRYIFPSIVLFLVCFVMALDFVCHLESIFMFFFFFTCMGVLPVCMSMLHIPKCFQRPKEAVRSPGTEVDDVDAGN